jgi:hypothetical protein
MSAYRHLADMLNVGIDVRYVPIADTLASVKLTR